MCTLKAMDNVCKTQAEVQNFSDCFDFRMDTRFKNMTFLIKGKDELSTKIAQEIREKHSFYNTYNLDMDLCSKPTPEQVQNFIDQISALDLPGSGMLIADKLYYSRLIEERPNFIKKLALVRPDYDTDYIQLMVDFAIGRHYASRVRVLKEKNASKEGISSYYKNIMPFDVLLIPTVEDLQILVNGAYIYQEIKLRHDISPKVYIQCSENEQSEKRNIIRLLSALCVDDISFFAQLGVMDIAEAVSNKRVLVITSQSRYTQIRQKVEELRRGVIFSAGFYVAKQPQANEVQGKEPDRKTYVENLIEKHQAYLKHLFKI